MRDKKKRALIFGLGLALFAGSSIAHGPTRQKVVETIHIEASAATVWAKIGNFGALQEWHPDVAQSTADQDNAIGSMREVKLKDGRAMREALERYDAEAMRYSYRGKNGGALPVTNYTSTVSVRADGEQAIVEWRGAFYRGYPNNNPPPDQNDEAAVAAVTAFYKSGLAHLKKVMEHK